MTAIDPPSAMHFGVTGDASSGARTEQARYRLDLRVHALIVLFNAMLLAYFAFRVCNIDLAMVPGEPVWVPMQPELLSYCVLAIFIAIAAMCLTDAHRSWREAAIMRAQPDDVADAARGW